MEGALPDLIQIKCRAGRLKSWPYNISPPHILRKFQVLGDAHCHSASHQFHKHKKVMGSAIWRRCAEREMIRKREVFWWGRAVVSRLNGYLALLYLAGGTLALPLSAEEITVTIPPDPPAQTAPSDTSAAQQPTLPSFAAGNSAPASVAQDTTSPPPETQQEAAPSPPPQPPAAAPQASKNQAKAKKAAPTETPAAAGSTDKPAHTTAAPAKPKTKKASASASCKGLDENACGGNKACIWVVGTPAEGSSKGTKAGCRSLAALKKEAAKADKAAKSGEPEVLPWASHTSTPSQSGAGTAATGETAAKPVTAKKAKTVATKKTAKPKETAPPAPAASEGGDQAPPSSDAPQAGSSGAD